MTLIITYSSYYKTVQVSDRRLTVSGALFDDEANKSVCVSCTDARFTIGYTGLARVGSIGTDLWVLETLREMGSSQIGIKNILEKIKNSAAKKIGKRYPLTFVFAGYKYNREHRKYDKFVVSLS